MAEVASTYYLVDTNALQNKVIELIYLMADCKTCMFLIGPYVIHSKHLIPDGIHYHECCLTKEKAGPTPITLDFPL